MKFNDRLLNQQRINFRDFRLERLNKQLICLIFIGREGRVKLLLVIIEIACAIETKVIAKIKNFIIVEFQCCWKTCCLLIWRCRTA